MAEEFKVRVGTELDSDGLRSQLNAAIKSLDNKKIKLEFDVDESSLKNVANKSSKKMRENAKAVENEFKSLLSLGKEIKSSRIELSGLDASTNEAKQLRRELSLLEAQYNTIYSKYGKKFSTSQKSALDKAFGSDLRQNAQVKNSYDQMLKDLKQIGSETKKQAKLSIDVDSSQVEDAERKLRELRASFNSVYNSLDKNLLSSGQAGQISNIKEQIERDLSSIEAKIKDTKKNLADSISDAINLSDYSSKLDNVSSQISNIKAPTDGLIDSNRRLRESYVDLLASEMDFRNGKIGIESLETAQANFNDELRRTNNLIQSNKAQQREMTNASKRDADATKLSQNKNIFSNQIDVWLKDNSAAVAQFGSRLREIQTQINAVDATGLNNLKSEFKQVTQEAKLADVATMTFGDRLKRQAREYASYFGVATVAFEGAQALRMMAQNVLDVDTAMTGLYRVTDLTSQQYSALYDNMISSAKEYGSTLEDTINATADWVRAGFDADTALGLADVSAMYQHVSDLDYNEASDNLLTAYNGFKDTLLSTYGGDDVAAVEHIADVYNELDNNFSVTSAGLGEGISRAASALQLAGNTFEESTAMIGAVTEVTQDPEKAGNAMKILSLRLRGMKGELQELGVETDENVENLSKMQGQVLNLTKGKVNIFDDNGDFESTYDIMKGIADVWDELSSTDQAQLLETIAGKDRANDVAALITNFADAEAMVTSALDSEGSASRENEKYLDSLQGRINSLTTSFQAFSNTAMDSDFLKGGVSAITSLIDAFNGLISTVGVLPTIAGGVAAALSFKGIGFTSIDKETNKWKIFGNTIEETKSILSSFKSGGLSKVFDKGFKDSWTGISDRISSDKKALLEYQNALDSGMTRQQAFDAHLANFSSEAARTYVRNLGDARVEIDDWVKSQNKMEVANKAQDKSFKNVGQILAEYKNGLQTTGLSQKEYIESVSQGNAVLGKYMSGVSSASVSLGGYVRALVGARVATVALEAASIALNAALTMGIGVAIGAAISWIADMVTANERLAESVEEASNSYKQQHSELMSGKSDFEDLAQSYAELSKGVDSLTGKNISLMPDEYEEYQNVVNQIASTIPSLVAGYDEQGNAILNCAGDVDTLTEAYNNLIVAENNKLLNGDGEEFKGLSDTLTDFQNKYNELQNSNDGLVAWNKKNTVDASNALEGMFDLPEINEDSVAKYIRNIDGVANTVGDRFAVLGQALKQKMSDMNLELSDMPAPDNAWSNSDDWTKYITKVYQEYPSVVKSAISDMDSQLDDAAESTKEAISAYMENAFLSEDYSNIDEGMQSIISSLVGNLDGEFIHSIIGNKTGDEAKRALTGWVDNLLSTIDGLDSSVQDKIKDAFDLQNMFSSGDISLGEYRSQLEEVSNLIDSIEGIDDEVKTELKMSLNADDVIGQYDTLVNRLKDLGVKGAEEFVSGLNSSELKAAQELVVNGEIDWEGKTPDEITAEIQRMAEVAEASSFKIDIEAETEGLDNLNSALSESYSATGLTSESIENIKSRYSDLEGFNPAAIFEKTTTGVRLNEKALASLEEQYVKTKKAAADQQLDTLTEEYSRLTEEMKKASDAGDKDLANSYKAQLDDLSATIESAQLAASAYDGLTSAYNNWINAQQQGQAGDIYDQIVSGRENAQTLADEGKWGNTELQSYVEMFSAPDAFDMATPEQYAAAWQSAIYKSNRYFSEGTAGIDNFISDVAAANSELVKMNENGEWEISPNFDTKDWAEAAGVAESTVEAIFGQMSEYGFDVPIGINTDSVDELVAESEAAVKSATEELQKYLGEDFSIDFDLNTDSFDTVGEKVDYIDGQLSDLQSKKEEINNSDATVEVKQQGIDAVNLAIDAAIQKKIELSQPAFMSVDSSQVDASMADALAKAQELQTAINELSTIQLQQQYGIEVDQSQLDSANQKVQEIAQTIANNKDLKMSLGFDESSSIDDIISGFKNNEVDIPINADTGEAKSATEELASNIEKIEDKDVTITVKVNGLDEVKELAESVDIATSVDGNVEDLSKFTEAAKELDGMDDNIFANITANLNGNLDGNKNLDNLSKFAEGAKALDGVKSANVDVKANLEANIGGFLGFNPDLDNLNKFAESAKNLADVESVDVDVKANLEANVGGFLGFNPDLDNLDKFAESAKKLADVGSYDVNVKANLDANVGGFLGMNPDLDNLDKFAESAKKLEGVSDADVSVKANLEANVGGFFGSNPDLDNLDKFAESAKKLEGISDSDVSVKANLDANVGGFFGSNPDLDNLDKFAESAKKLGNIEDVDVSVKANLDANVGGFFGSNPDLDNLDKFAESAKKLGDIENVDVSVKANLEANTGGFLGMNPDLDNLDKFADAAKKLANIDDVDVSVKANLEANTGGFLGMNPDLDNLDKFADAAEKLDGINDSDVSVKANLEGNIDRGIIDNLSDFADGAKKLDGIKDVSVTVEANLNGDIGGFAGINPAINNLEAFADGAKKLQNVGDSDVTVTANLESNLGGFMGINPALSNLESFADGAKDLQGVGDVTSNVTANLNSNIGGFMGINPALSNLSEFAEGAEKVKGVGNVEANVSANLDGNIGGVLGFNPAIGNLNSFADGAEKIKGIGDVEASVTANLDGNIGGFLGNNAALNNLSSFADGARQLQDVGSTDVSVTANLNGNIGDGSKSGAINNIGTFASAANSLKNVGSPTVTVTANVQGDISDEKVSQLSEFSGVVSTLSATPSPSVTVNVSADTGKISSVQSALQGLSSSGVMHDYNANVTVNADVSSVNAVKSALSGLQSSSINVSVYATGTETVYALQAAISAVQGKSVNVAANVSGTSEVNDLTAAISRVNSKSVEISASVYGTSGVNSLANAISSVRSKTVTITANYETNGKPSSVNGTANVNGTAFANGTSGRAFKSGDWGTKDSGVALMGELGTETIVRGGKFFTVGDNGAGFYKYKKGDIIFNHKQTEELFKYGKVTSGGGRGKMFANGTAYSEGTAFAEGRAFATIGGGTWRPGGIGGSSSSSSSGNTVVNNYNYNYNVSSGSTSNDYSSSSSSSSSTESAEEFKETVDWIEVAIDRIERALSSLDRVATSTFKSWSERTAALNEQMVQTRNEIDLQSRAYERYMQEANSVGLSADWQDKVKNGKVDIEQITDEGLKEQIDNFQTWIEKALDAKDAIEELNEQLSELYQQKFENVSAQYDGVLGDIQHEQDVLEQYIAQTEAKGWMVSKEYYRAQIFATEDQINTLKKLKQDQLNQLQEEMQAGTLEKGGQEWYERVSAINETTLAIEEATTSLIELDAAFREVDWKVFDMLQEQISDITKESDFLIDLMSNEKLYDDRGQLTDKGMASMGLHGVNYNVYMAQADKYAEEIKKIEADLARDPYDQDLMDRKRELIELQQESILNAEEEKNAIKDMVEEGINLELDALNDLIDKYKEALETQKD